ncbi:T9SS type A sorting domain-containing protein [Xanthocytophaga agilis]|uniref:T9SS type A sorting domain-containing protein n=1 Tax=Xanthocytophaga agilis TaxID=3048010 RepID=A0AAE3UFM6_9BACT|nr:T9SS type A sorting domain-containing protein [Xanthocytophaga agilis]MDJ1502576.1 T9SS type A sorting domain-containing protein [Xanthocytophaga agilis]
MKKSVLFLLMVLGGLLADFSVLGQAPTITTPANNATGINPYTQTMTGRLSAGTTPRTGIRRLRVQLYDSDGVTLLLSSAAVSGAGYFSPTIIPTTSTTATYTYPLWNLLQSYADLDPSTSQVYYVRVQTSTATAGWFGPSDATVLNSTLTRITITEPALQNPQIISPANGASFDLCQNLTITVNANYQGARTLLYLVYPTSDPSSPVVDSDADGINPTFANATTATTNYALPAIDTALLAASTPYTIEVYSVDINGELIGTTTSTFTTGVKPPSSIPVITSPLDGATDVSRTPSIAVAAYTGCGTLTSRIIEVDTDPAFGGSSKQTSLQGSGNGAFSWTPATLEFGTQYYVRVTFQISGTTVGEKVISFTTESLVIADPLLISPADEATLDLCSDVVANVNANSTSARSLVFKVFPIGPGPTIFQQTYNFADGNAATTPFNITLLRSLFADNAHYLVELTTRTGANNTGTLIGQVYNDWFTGVNQSSEAANTPVITSPADGVTVNTVTPTIIIQSPFAGCTLNSVLYEILDGTVGNTVVASQNYTTATYNWTVPSFLTAGNTYRARVTYNTANGTFSDTNTFTVSATPGVSIQSPLSLTGLNPCGFPVIVNAYPGATTIKVEYRQKPSGSFGTAFYSTASGSDYTFSFTNTQLLANTNYEMRLTAGTGTGGSFTAITGSATLFDFSTGGIGGTLTPTLSTPLDGATGVSVTPTITFAPYQGDCGAITNYQIEIVPVGGTGDWSTRTGYYYASSASPSFSIPNGVLTAGITYKIRISTEVSLNGGVVGYYSNYDGDDSNPNIYTFTTVSPLETYLELVTSTSNVVGGEIYLNSLNQTLQVLAVSGATQYEIQLSTDSTFTSNIHYTATSASNVFAFNPNSQQLQSGEKYYIRVRISAPSVGPWTSAANIKHVYNSLHPTYADSPVGNVSSNSMKLRGWHMKNATSMFFQIATDVNFTNLVDVHGPYGPISADPAGSGIAYERYSYRKWINGRLVAIDISARDDNYQAFTVLGEYDYVRYLIPGKTYYLRVKNVRTAANGTYLQTGYWANVAAFTVPSYTLTPTATMAGTLTSMFVTPSITASCPPAGVWNVTGMQLQISTDAGFTGIVRDITAASYATTVNSPLNYNTTYYLRVRAQASNNPLGAGAWSPWSATVTFKTMASPSGRVAAAATSLSEDEQSQSVAYPNPFNSTISVTLKAEYAAVTVSLVDQTGKVVDHAQSAGGNTVVLGKKSSQGLYLIRITDQTGVKETIKVVKQY